MSNLKSCIGLLIGAGMSLSTAKIPGGNGKLLLFSYGCNLVATVSSLFKMAGRVIQPEAETVAIKGWTHKDSDGNRFSTTEDAPEMTVKQMQRVAQAAGFELTEVIHAGPDVNPMPANAFSSGNENFDRDHAHFEALAAACNEYIAAQTVATE